MADPVWTAGALPNGGLLAPDGTVAVAAPVPQTVVVHAPSTGGMLAPDGVQHPHQQIGRAHV